MVSDDIDDDAIDRIVDELDYDYDDIDFMEWKEIKRDLDARFSNDTMSQTAKKEFATAIIERAAFKGTSEGKIEDVIERRTILTGATFGAQRTVMITDHKGRFAGRPENIITYIQNFRGTEHIMYRNKLTGKIGRIK